MSDVIDRRDKFEQGWSGGLPETTCGYGSRLDQTVAQRAWIPQMVEKYRIRTIADIGAGDLNWVRHVTWPAGVSYTAYDLIPRHHDVQKLDMVREPLPCVDLIMCLWVLNHLPIGDCIAAIYNIRMSVSRYLLMTDRPKWHAEQPPLIRMPHIEELLLRPDTGDRLLLVDLWQC